MATAPMPGNAGSHKSRRWRTKWSAVGQVWDDRLPAVARIAADQGAEYRGLRADIGERTGLVDFFASWGRMCGLLGADAMRHVKRHRSHDILGVAACHEDWGGRRDFRSR